MGRGGCSCFSPALRPRLAQSLLVLCDVPDRDLARAFGCEWQKSLTPQIRFWPQRNLVNSKALSLAARGPSVSQPFLLKLTRTYEERTHQRAKNYKDQQRSQLPAVMKPLFSTLPCKGASLEPPERSGLHCRHERVRCHVPTTQLASLSHSQPALERRMQTRSSRGSPTQNSPGTGSFFTVFLCRLGWKLQGYHHIDQIIWWLHNMVTLLGAT